MKVAQFSTPIAKLQNALETLQRTWSDTKQHWDDTTGANLEKVHLEPLFQELKEIIEATVPLSEGMNQAQRMCGPQNQQNEY
jgi:hypothetical protein